MTNIIFAYVIDGVLDSVCEGFENFIPSEEFLREQRLNYPIDVVSFIGPSLDDCWEALTVYFDHFIPSNIYLRVVK